MATQIKQTPGNRHTKRTSILISGSAYMVAVGGAPRGSKAKTGKTTGEECRITPRYLRPPISSCHDLCKHGIKDELLEVKGPTRRLRSRKIPVIKDKGVIRAVIPVERKTTTITKPKPTPDPKIRAPDKPVEVIKRGNSLPYKKIQLSTHGLSTKDKSTKNGENMVKNQAKAKPVSSSIVKGSTKLYGKKNKKEGTMPKATHTGSLPINYKLMCPLKEQNRMTKTKLKKVIPEKVKEMTEMTLNEAETTELEFVSPTVEIIQTPSMLTTESTNLSSPESPQSSSEKQVSNLEFEHSDDKEVLEEECEYAHDEEVIISEDDYEIETSEGNCKYRVVICEDKENGGFNVKFRRGRVVELQSEDDGPKRLKFRRGRVMEDNGDEQSMERISFKKKIVDDDAGNDCCSETVTLKHQEMQKRKEAQDLLNRMIEETASKLVENRKTKVGALVGAFETVISLQEDTHAPSSE